MPHNTERGFTSALREPAAGPPSETSPTPPVSETAAARPGNGASKASWVAYAESVGVDATGTKGAIIARVDAL